MENNSRHPEINVRTWIEVDTAAARHNYQTFRKLIACPANGGGRKCQLMAVVKSNAYGHDLFQFSKLMVRFGANWLGVDSIVEGLALRKAGIEKPILVLGYTLPRCFNDATQHNLSLTISTKENLKPLIKSHAKFHLKIDTGMHRQGFFTKDVPAVLRWLKQNQLPVKQFEGVYTHFAAAKNPAFPKYTMSQLEQFKKAVELINQAGFQPIRHAAATSGTLLFPETHLNLVRVGIGLYGLWPSKETEAAKGGQIKLKPVLSWKTIIGEIKKLPAGAKVGYDLTHTMEQAGTVAILPIGYWHGYPRALSGISHVIIRGKKARVVGRVSMDMIAVLTNGIPAARVGDEVVLIGDDLVADYLASLSDTTNYEIVTRLNPLIKRVYL